MCSNKGLRLKIWRSRQEPIIGQITWGEEISSKRHLDVTTEAVTALLQEYQEMKYSSPSTKKGIDFAANSPQRILNDDCIYNQTLVTKIIHFYKSENKLSYISYFIEKRNRE